MSTKSRIEWTDATWNPMTGCTPVSEACDHCYAERIAGRNLPVTRCPECEGRGHYGDGHGCCPTCMGRAYVGFAPTFHPSRLDIPLHWRKPRRIFVCSMSDLFHEAFSDERIDQVLAIVDRCPQHTFLVLTKRPERMRDHMLDWLRPQEPGPSAFVFSNLWLGVTVENQARADERIPILLDTPAVVRFVSVEPMLGPVDLTRLSVDDVVEWDVLQSYRAERCGHGTWQNEPAPFSSLDWVICGGETGPGARPMQPDWALDLYRQTRAAGVPFFWKKAGKWLSSGEHFSKWASEHVFDPADRIEEWGRMVQTREFPEVKA